jgi:hypothetical protein
LAVFLLFVTVRDSKEARYFEIPEKLVKEVRQTVFRGYAPKQSDMKQTEKMLEEDLLEQRDCWSWLM